MVFRMDLSRDEAVTPYAMRGSMYWKYRNDVTGEDGTMDVIHTDLGLGVRMTVWRGLYMCVQGTVTRQSEAVFMLSGPGRYVTWRLAGEVGLGWWMGR